MLNSQERIVSVNGKNIVLCDAEGKCIASSDPKKIGEKVKLPEDIFNQKKILSKTDGNKKNLMVPLNCPYKVRAFLVMNKNHKNEIPVIKNFAEMLVRDHLETQKQYFSIDDFVQKIVKDDLNGNTHELQDDIKKLQIDFSVSRLAILIELSGFEDQYIKNIDSKSNREEIICSKKNAIEFAINNFFTRNKDLFTAYLGGDRFVVFKAVEEKEKERMIDLLKKSYSTIFLKLKNADITKVSVSIGNPYSDVNGLVDSFKEAELTMSVTNNQENQVHYYGDLGILRILADGDRNKKISFANKIIDRIDDPALLETLEVFFECNLSITETAEKMKIHRNTVIYRLNKLNEVLDLDPRIINEAIMIQSALLIRKTLV